MRRLLFPLLIVIAGMAGAGDVQGQTRADSAAVLLNAAEQLRVRGETGAARALLELIQQQYGDTPAAQQVARMRGLLQRTPDAERSGRIELLVFGTTYGAWLGIATPLMFDSDDPESFGVGLLLGAPIGFFAAKSYADTYSPTEGQTRALTFGGSWGTMQGFMLGSLTDFGVEEECTEFGCFDSGDNSQELITSAVLGGLTGIATGAVIARKPISSGTAAAVSLSGLWGTWFGFAFGILTDQDEGGDDDGLLATTMIGGNAALLATGLTTPYWEISENRARLISVGGLIGALAGAGVLLLLEADDESSIALPMATSAAGLIAAGYWTRTYDARPPEDNDDASAFLNVSRGRFKMGTPLPSLQLQRRSSGIVPGVYVPVFNARF
jgi:hypothetical protein